MARIGGGGSFIEILGGEWVIRGTLRSGGSGG